MVDKNALRFNQATLTALVILGFILGGTTGIVLVALTAASLLIGAAAPAFGPIGVVYRHVFVRLGILHPKRVPDDMAPHRFAQLMGGACLTIAAVLLALGFGAAGWVLAWIVIALALTNLVLGFCMGCFIFLQLGRIGLIRRGAEAQ